MIDKKAYIDKIATVFTGGVFTYLADLIGKGAKAGGKGALAAGKGYHGLASKLPIPLQSAAYTAPVLGGTLAYSRVAAKPKTIRSIAPRVSRW